jgi:hypothetical protein
MSIKTWGSHRSLSAAFLIVGVLALLSAATASAQATYIVTVNTSSLPGGTKGFVDFQFNPGSPSSQEATAQIQSFTTDGALDTSLTNPFAFGNPGTVGNASGTLPGTVTLDNGCATVCSADNEYLEGIDFGTTITFVLQLNGPAVTSPNPAAGESSFFLYFYNLAGTATLLSNNAVTGVAAEVDVAPTGIVTTGFGFATFGTPTFQVSYAANLKSGDSFVDVTNDGASDPAGTAGDICVNAYAFDANEELLACCYCLVTPNGLASMSVNNSLFASTLTGQHPSSAVIALVASTPGAGNVCDATSVTAGALAPGMKAWSTTLHELPSGSFGATEVPFSTNALSIQELTHLTSFCGFIIGDGTGSGICKGCTTAAQ